MSAEKVVTDQRGRIHAAMIELVAERDYEALTVRELARRAGVSQPTFYKHFSGKEECFLDTYDMVERRTAQRVMTAYRSGRDWQERLRLAFRAFALEIERDPQAARFCFAESFAAGTAALERIQHTATLFAAMIDESFAHAPDGTSVPPIVVRGAVSGLAHVARSRLFAGREAELPDLADELMDWVLGFRSEAAGGLDEPGDPSIPTPPVVAEPVRDEAVGAGTEAAPTLTGDRALILAAVSKLAASDGYSRLTVSRILATAGVSRKDFDAHFADVSECFLAALEFHTDRALERAAREGASRSSSWPGGIHGTLAVLCEDIARDPVVAKLAFIEVFAAGSEGMRRRARLTEAAVDGFRASAPPDQRPSELAAEASIGAVWGLIHYYIAAARPERLPQRAGVLSYLMLAPAIGADGAAAAILDEQARKHPIAEGPQVLESVESAGEPRKLSPGPGRSAEEVAADQRARIHAAMISTVVEKGYSAVTMRDLAQQAGVSTRTLYQHFAGKEECFLDTYDMVERRTAEHIATAYRNGGDWEDRLRRAFRAFGREIERDPQAARLTFLEAFGAGRAALERIQHAATMFANLISTSFAEAPDRVAVPPIVVRGIVAGLTGVPRSRLLAGREGELSGLADELIDWTLCFRSEAAGELDVPGAPFVPESEGAQPESDGEPLAASKPVLGDERAMILKAAASLAAADGYSQLTVPRIRAAAGVSRKSFDAHFDDIGDCFQAALKFHSDRALERAVRAGGSRSDGWPAGVHGTITALCAEIARDPVLAKLAFIEVFAPGGEGRRRRMGLMEAGVAGFRAGAPPAQRPSELAAEASLGAAWGLIHSYLVVGHPEQLPQHAGELSYLVLAPAIGAPAAVATIRNGQARTQAGGEPSSASAAAH